MTKRTMKEQGEMKRTQASRTLNRRSFVRGLGGFAMAGTGPAALGPLAGCAMAPGLNIEPGYVDIHTHLAQEWGDNDPLTADGLLRWMDEHGIAQAIVLPLVSPESWAFPISTDYVLRETLPHRDRLIPFCAIDPRTINLGGKRGMVTQLKRFVDAGAKGFGEHKTGVAMDDPRNMTVFESVAEVGLPLLFHLDNSRNMDKPGLPGLEKVLQTFPELTMIGHANGWWASIDGAVTQADFQAYPKRTNEPGGAIDRLMEKYPNLYGDLSAGSGANAISRDPAFGREFLIRRADRLLFGSDYLEQGQAVPQFKLFESLGLPEDVKKKIFHDNARRILKLAPG